MKIVDPYDIDDSTSQSNIKIHDPYDTDKTYDIDGETQNNNKTSYLSPDRKNADTSLINDLSNNPIINAILGAGDSAAHALSLGYANPQNASGTSYDVGRFAGSILPYSLAELATSGAATPLIEAGVAPKIASLIGRVGAGSLFGAATSPQDRLKGAEYGTLGAGAAEGVAPILNAAGKTLNVFRPQQLVKKLFELAPATLKDSVSKANDLYNNIFNKFGNSSIYGDVTKPASISNYPSEKANIALNTPEIGSSQYLNFSNNKIKKFYNSDLNKMHDLFMQNPTLENAHGLQSQLGNELRGFEQMRKQTQGYLPAADRKIYDTYKGAREAVKSDIDQFLNKNNPASVKDYANANNYFATNVVPNRNLNVILNKIGDSATPKTIINTIEKAGRRGKDLPNYAHTLLDNLKTRMTAKDLAQKGAGMALGLASTHGMSIPMEIAGAGLGSILGSPISKGLSYLPINKTANVLSKSYSPAAKTLLAGILNQ